jgi:hypothetical protein
MKSPKPFSPQGIAGLMTMIAVAGIAILPFIGSAMSISEARAGLMQRQNSSFALAGRMKQDREQMSLHPTIYQRSLGDFNAAAVSSVLSEQCEYAASAFAEHNLAAHCVLSSDFFSGGLVYRRAVLTASGEIGALLASLDKIETLSRIDRLAVENDPQASGAAMELRFVDVSDGAETGE